MADEFDPFKGDVGVKDDYEGVIADAVFLSDPQFNNGNTFLQLTIHADDGDTVLNRYPCGPDWASYDGGATVEHPSKKNFDARTQIIELITHAFASGGEQIIRERGMAELRADGQPFGPRKAAIWVGTRWHWGVIQKPYSFTNRETNEKVEGISNRPLPDKYLGLGDASSAPTPTAPAPTATSDGEVDPDTIAKLKVLAAAHPYDKWVDEALPLAMGNDTLIKKLGDSSFYESLKA